VIHDGAGIALMGTAPPPNIILSNFKWLYPKEDRCNAAHKSTPSI